MTLRNGFFIFAALLLIVPFVFDDSYTRHIFIVAFIYAVIASNWDLTLGYTGIFNFSHVTFFGVGVYTSAIAAKTFGVPPALAILLGGIAAPVAAAIVSLPVARLKGIYVVLITSAFGQLILQLVLSQSHITGGAEGMVRIPSIRIDGYNFARDDKFAYYYMAWGILVCSTIFLTYLTNSQFGKSLVAIRENEDYATARGISVTRQRVLAMVASAVFTGLAGGFFAIYLRVASPETFAFGPLTLALSMVLLGGYGTIFGPIFAAIVLTFGTEFLAGIRGMEEARFILIAVAIVVVLRWRPAGLISIFTRS